MRPLDDEARRGWEELVDMTQNLASVTEYLELLAEMEKKKGEFTTTVARLQEKNRTLA